MVPPLSSRVPLCGLRFLFVSESEFSFLGLIASNLQPIPHCAMRTRVKQCLIDVQGVPGSFSSPHLISGPVLHSGVQVPWAATVPSPLQTMHTYQIVREQQAYSPPHLWTRLTQTKLDNTEFKLGWLVILMLYTHSFSTESCPSHTPNH